MIDVFFKIKSLYELGYEITLHCFKYNQREVSQELKGYCKKIFVYERSSLFKNFLHWNLPSIVFTRNHPELLTNLLANDAPILFEGLHCTFFLNHVAIRHRIKLVRMHNIEHDYYKALSLNETNLLKKIYFLIESYQLKKHERILKYAQSILAISPNDQNQLAKAYQQATLLNPFHGFTLNVLPQSEPFALYHGKLSVNENHEAAMYLVKEVFSKLAYPLYIAGNEPLLSLKNSIKKYKHIHLIENPSMDELEKLIQTAHINVLPTFQATGIKLKLLNVLFNAKHILTNQTMVHNTGLAACVNIANTSKEMIAKLKELKNTPFGFATLEPRKKALHAHFNNENNAQQINQIIQTLNSKTL